MAWEPVTLGSPIGDLLIRPYEERDVPLHLSYLYDSPKEFLEGIGFDPSKFPSREEMERGLRSRLREAGAPMVVVAAREGRIVALVVLDLRNQEDRVPRIHFHVLDPRDRGRGVGGPVLRAGILALGRIHGIPRFLIEPKATNAPMNALMRKLGFRRIKDCNLPAGPLTGEMQVTQYEVLVPGPQPPPPPG